MNHAWAVGVLAMVGILAGAPGGAEAQPVKWTGDAGTSDWNTDGNWSGGSAPTASDDTYIGVSGVAATVDLDGTGTAGELYVGYDAAGTLNVGSGGALSVDNLHLSPLGSAAGLTLSGNADVYAETGIYVDGPATIEMTGGLLHAALSVAIPDGEGAAALASQASAAPGELVFGPGSSGQFNLHGGTVLTGSMSLAGALTIDITHGALLVNNADVETILGWIRMDKISSFGVFHDPFRFNITDGSVTARIANPGPGDYNADGYVTDADYTVWADTYGSTTDLRADGSRDGVVSDADYTIWADSYGASANGIPEPVTMLLLGLGSLGLLRRKR